MTRFWAHLAVATAALAPVFLAAQTTPRALQERGLARIEDVRAQVRRSGLQPSLLQELATAESELGSSYRQFRASSSDSEAAASLVGMATAQRLRRVFLAVQGQASAELGHSVRSNYEEGIALARKAGNAPVLVHALTGIAQIDEFENDYGAANIRITEALRAASSCPNQDCMLDALLSKVEVESGRGELFAAASHVNGVLALLKSHPDPNRLYSAYKDRAEVYRSMSDGCSYNQQKSVDICYRLFDLAKADLENARRVASEAGFAGDAGMAEENIHEVESLRALTQRINSMAEQALKLVKFEPETPRDVLATEQILLGRLSPQEVEAVKALSKAAGPGMPGPLTTWMQAELDEIQGRQDAALEGYLRSIRAVEEDRRKLSEDSARASFLDDKVSLYERPIFLLLNRKRYDEAFSLLEASRARAVADLLSTRSVALSKPVDRQVFASLARKRAEISSLQKRFFDATLFAQSDDSGSPEEIAEAQTRLAGLEAAYEQTLLRLGREAPSVRGAAVSRPVSLERLQEVLRQDRMDLLYYYVTDNALILIHIGPGSFHVRSVFLPRLALIRKVAALRASMSRRNATFRDDIAKQLFLYLVQPALIWLTSDRIVVVPQGDLQSLPFQALRNPADGSFLGEKLQITYAPSATILAQLASHQSLEAGPLLAAADPALNGARQEVGSLARLYPDRPKVVTGSLIRKVDFERWAGDYSVVHLAVHGRFDGQEPLLSYVKLAPGGGEEGNLSAAEMFGLPLERARLVTLSACETGRVATTRSNDIQGIQQALLFAGAQSLLVSAWEVDSEATSIWMQTFYREAQTKPPAEAARQAIRALRADPKYSRPFFWAPFLLVAR